MCRSHIKDVAGTLNKFRGNVQRPPVSQAVTYTVSAPCEPCISCCSTDCASSLLIFVPGSTNKLID